MLGSRIIANVISQGEVMPEQDGCILLSGLFIKKEDVGPPLHIGRMLYIGMETEIRVMCLQPKQCQRLLAKC